GETGDQYASSLAMAPYRPATEATVTDSMLAVGVPNEDMAVRAAQGQTGLRGARLLDTSLPVALHAPTLVFHGPDDTLAPWADSEALARLRPDLVALHAVPQAPHAAMWNAGPGRYEETLRRFLTPLM
ncbi:hypothetical protein ACTU45_24620, partial [Streptomyces sp. 24-1644]